jgi:ubiquinone biosynthesis protein COQ4
MLQSETGRKILLERPYVTPETVPIEKLSSFPEGTLGRAYAEFMSSRGFQSDERSIVKFVDDPELAYVMTRYRQVHDFWHCLTEMDTTVMSEVSLKALEFLQTGILTIYCHHLYF